MLKPVYSPAARTPDHSRTDLCELTLLGTPQLKRPGCAPMLLGPRDAALLCLVVLHGPLARATLAGWMWPLAAPSRALNNLRQRMFQLRQLAGSDLLQTHGGITLASAWRHDLVCHPLPWRPGDVPPQLMGDVDLQAWPALADRIDAERRRWLHVWQHAAAEQAEDSEAAGRLVEAQALAGALVQCDPTNEDAHRRVMRLHYLRGDNAAALAAYAECRRLLAQHLDARPGAQTEAIREVVAAGGALAPPLSDGNAHQPTALDSAAVLSSRARDALALHRAVLRRPPRLAGRDAAWQAMLAAWQAGRPILLHGVAGVGKSRLAEDFARAQGAVQVMRAQPKDRASPLGTLARWLCELLPSLAPPAWALGILAHLLPPGAQRCEPPPTPEQLQQAVLAWLAGWSEADLGSLLIDDWQWVDSESLLMLVAWLRQHSTLPVRLILVQTNEIAEVDDRAVSGVPWWLQDAVTGTLLLPLAPLPLPAFTELLVDLSAAHAIPTVDDTHLPSMALRLHQASGGLPGSALALLRAVPASAWCAPGGSSSGSVDAGDLAAARQSAIAAAVKGRMGALPPSALRLLRLAALAGAQFDVPLAASILGVHALDLTDDWTLLCEANWLDEDGLLPQQLREAVAAGLPEVIRRVLHAQLAEVLADHAAAPEHCWKHWAAAQRWPEAAAAAQETARQAKAAHMPRAELIAWDAAAQAADAAGDATGAWRSRLGAVWPALSIEPTDKVLRRTAHLHDTAMDTAGRVGASLAQCRAALNASESAIGGAAAERALSLAGAVGDTSLVLHASSWLWLARAMAGDVAPALAQLQVCARAVLDLPDQRLRLDVLGALGYVQHMAGDYGAAMESIAIAADCAEQLGELGDALEQRLNLSLCASAMGDRSRALEAGDQALALWRRQGEPAGGAVPSLQLELGNLKIATGQFSSGVPLLEHALAHFREQPGTTWRVIAEHRLAHAWLRLGQPARAAHALSPLPADASAGGHAARAIVLSLMAQWADKPAEAHLRDALQQHGDRLQAMDRRSLELHLAAVEQPAASLARCDILIGSLSGDPAVVPSLDIGTAVAAASRPAMVHAVARRALAMRRLGQGAEAAENARIAWRAAALTPPLVLDHLSFCHLVVQAASEDPDLQREVLAAATAWLDAAEPHLLPAWRHGFFNQHPVNRDLRALAAKHALGLSAAIQ